MPAPLYFENLTVGQTFSSASITIDAQMIKAFAAQFDPQPFHLDEHAPSLFNGLAASGWHTAATTMKLFVASVPLTGGLIGGRIEELLWPRPVRPGDTLRVVSEVIDLRPSNSHPDRGWIKFRVTTYNQHDELVQIMVSNVVGKRKG